MHAQKKSPHFLGIHKFLDMSKYHNANLFKKVVDGLKKREAVMPETNFTTAGKLKKKKKKRLTETKWHKQHLPLHFSIY